METPFNKGRGQDDRTPAPDPQSELYKLIRQSNGEIISRGPTGCTRRITSAYTCSQNTYVQD